MKRQLKEFYEGQNTKPFGPIKNDWVILMIVIGVIVIIGVATFFIT